MGYTTGSSSSNAIIVISPKRVIAAILWLSGMILKDVICDTVGYADDVIEVNIVSSDGGRTYMGRSILSSKQSSQRSSCFQNVGELHRVERTHLFTRVIGPGLRHLPYLYLHFSICIRPFRSSIQNILVEIDGRPGKIGIRD